MQAGSGPHTFGMLRTLDHEPCRGPQMVPRSCDEHREAAGEEGHGLGHFLFWGADKC